RAHARRRPGRDDPGHEHARAGRRRRPRPRAAAPEPARADPARGRRALAGPGAGRGALPQAARGEALRRAPIGAGVAPEPHHGRGPDGRACRPGPPRRRRRAGPRARGRRRGPGEAQAAPARDDAAPRRRRRAGRRRRRPRRPMSEARPPTARSLLWPRRPSAYLGMLAAVVGAVSRVAVVPLFVTPPFDSALAAPAALPRLLAVAGAVVLGGALARRAEDALLGRAAAMAPAAARRAVCADLRSRPPGTLPGTSGSLASRVITDRKEVENYVRYGLGSLVAESVTLGLILGALVRADVRAAALLVALGVPAALALRGLGSALQRAAAGSMEGTEALGRHIQEGVKHHETVAAFGARPFMLRRFDAVNRLTAAAGARRSLLAGLQVPVTQVLLYGALGAVVVVLAGGVRRGEMTVGQMVSFLT